MTTITEHLQSIQERIDIACKKANRNPEEVKLHLANKTIPPDRIIQAFDAGYTRIAENKIQEVRKKYKALKAYSHHNHFIGHLQSNKVKFLIQNDIECLHSLDRKR